MKLIISVITIFFVFSSFLFLLHETNHDCTGKDCPVCAFMHTMENNFQIAGDGQRPFIKILSVCPEYMLFVFIAFLFVMDKSLTGKKIRLNI